MTMPADFYLGNDWLVQPSLNRISNGGKSNRIPAKYMQVLICLAERPGEAVRREHLMETVWKDTIVVEESLTRAISELRKILDDDSRHSHVIETIPKIGYRLVAPVRRNVKLPISNLTALPDPKARGLEASHEQSARIDPPRRRLMRPSILFAGVILILMIAFTLWIYPNRSAQTASPTLRTVPLTSYQGFERQPALSPDGQKLAFVWNGGTGQVDGIYVKEIGSEQSTRLTDDLTNASDPAWSHDGRQLASRTDESPAISPDGEWIAFVSDRSGSPQIWKSNWEGSEAIALTNWNEVKMRTPSWSPDGRLIAFVTNPQGQFDVFVVSSNGGEPQRLSATAADESAPTWSSDGRWIYFSVEENGCRRINKVSLSKLVVAPSGAGRSERRQISNDPQSLLDPRGRMPEGITTNFTRAIESSDGRWLYFAASRGDTTEFWRQRCEDNAAELIQSFSGSIGEDWEVRNNGIYFFRFDASCHPTFSFFSFETHQVSQLYRSANSSFNFDVTPDGRTLVFDQFDRSESDIMMLENF